MMKIKELTQDQFIKHFLENQKGDERIIKSEGVLSKLYQYLLKYKPELKIEKLEERYATFVLTEKEIIQTFVKFDHVNLFNYVNEDCSCIDLSTIKIEAFKELQDTAIVIPIKNKYIIVDNSALK